MTTPMVAKCVINLKVWQWLKTFLMSTLFLSNFMLCRLTETSVSAIIGNCFGLWLIEVLPAALASF